MNEAETRAELIDPALKEAGWGVVDGSRVRREIIAPGRLLGGGKREPKKFADYVLVYRDQKLAVLEAKERGKPDTEGVAQAKDYAAKLQTRFAYSTNGDGIYQIDMETGKERYVQGYPSPEELWAETLATGTGKTFIAFQIAWKLFQSRWTLARDGKRRPRVLFLADRNILADQAYNDFSAFPEDALTRVSPSEIRKKGSVPKNASIFFTIFQTFMTGTDDEGDPSPYFGDYPPDFFDFIVID